MGLPSFEIRDPDGVPIFFNQIALWCSMQKDSALQRGDLIDAFAFWILPRIAQHHCQLVFYFFGLWIVIIFYINRCKIRPIFFLIFRQSSTNEICTFFHSRTFIYGGVLAYILLFHVILFLYLAPSFQEKDCPRNLIIIYLNYFNILPWYTNTRNTQKLTLFSSSSCFHVSLSIPLFLCFSFFKRPRAVSLLSSPFASSATIFSTLLVAVFDTHWVAAGSAKQVQLINHDWLFDIGFTCLLVLPISIL